MLLSGRASHQDVIDHDCTRLSFEKLLHAPLENLTPRGDAIGHS